MVRIRIVQKPTSHSIDGVRLDAFELGHQYEVGNALGALFLSEGWAEPLPLDEPASEMPFREQEPLERHQQKQHPENPTNLISEEYQFSRHPVADDLAADFRRRKRWRR